MAARSREGWLALVVAACSGSSAPGSAPDPTPERDAAPAVAVADAAVEPSPAPSPRQSPDLDIEWSMTRERHALRIDYQVNKRAPGPVTLWDGLPNEGIVVASSEIPGTLAFRIGLVDPVDTSHHRNENISGRAVDSRLRGTVRVPLPLHAAQPFAEPNRIPPLDHEATSAYLEIGYNRGVGLRASRHMDRLRGETRPLPKGLPRAPNTAPELDWSMSIDGDRLRIDYEVTNDTDHPVYLLDTFSFGRVAYPDAIIAYPGEFPDTVAFILGHVELRGVISESEPTLRRRRLARGSKAHGAAYVSLPLRGHDETGHTHPFSSLSPTTRTAFLDIAYVDRASDSEFDHKVLRGRATPLPAGVEVRATRRRRRRRRRRR